MLQQFHLLFFQNILYIYSKITSIFKIILNNIWIYSSLISQYLYIHTLLKKFFYNSLKNWFIPNFKKASVGGSFCKWSQSCGLDLQPLKTTIYFIFGFTSSSISFMPTKKIIYNRYLMKLIFERAFLIYPLLYH